MNKTKIEWCDSTWNPVTGCLHNCPYCYARKIAHRFSPEAEGMKKGAQYAGMCKDGCYEISERTGYAAQSGPYPFGFEPTLLRYRLGEPQRKTKGQNIFVCSMADLFGYWVPDEWLDEIFKACGKADQHRYLFLTKNPSGYKKFYRSELDYRYNHWFGTTATDDKSFEERGFDLFEATGATSKRRANRYMSIEPLLDQIKYVSLKNVEYLDWVIIGAESGNQKGKIVPQRHWIEGIVDECTNFNVPVFMKESLLSVMGEENMIREFPEGLKR